MVTLVSPAAESLPSETVTRTRCVPGVNLAWKVTSAAIGGPPGGTEFVCASDESTFQVTVRLSPSPSPTSTDSITSRPSGGLQVKVVGGGKAIVGGVFWPTTIATGLEADSFPAASLATALRVCEPFAVDLVSQIRMYGVVVISVPRSAPSSLNWTAATLRSSEASAVTRITPDTVALFVGEVMATTGGAASPGGKLSGAKWTPT